MGDVRWDLLTQYPNAGASFGQAFQQGMQHNQEQAGRNALAKLVTNPSDQQALSAAAQYDPGAALQVQQSQRKYTDEQHQQWAKYAGELAKWATDPQKWDQAIDYIVQSGHPEAAQLKGKFSPALRANFMAQGGISEDKPDNGRIVTPQPGGGAGILDAQGNFRWVVQPNDGSQPAPAQGLPRVTDQATYDAVPPGQQYMAPDGHVRVKGGQSPQGSGGFQP